MYVVYSATNPGTYAWCPHPTSAWPRVNAEVIWRSLGLEPVFSGDGEWDLVDLKGRLLTALAVGGAVPDLDGATAESLRGPGGLRSIRFGIPPRYLEVAYQQLLNLVEWAIEEDTRICAYQMMAPGRRPGLTTQRLPAPPY